jgi:hypothetical protein
MSGHISSFFDFRTKDVLSLLLAVALVLLLSIFSATAFADDDDDDDDDDDNGGGFGQFAIITDLDDMHLGTWTGATELSDESKHCVATTNKEYSVTATGDGLGGAFRLSSGAAEIPFQVYYKEKKNGNLVQMSPGAPVYNLKSKKIKKKSPYCRGGKMVVEVRMLGSDMAKVPAGPYSGTLSLMVVPQ